MPRGTGDRPMPKGDQFASHFEKQREKKKAIAKLNSEDDPPLPDTPVEQAKKATPVGRNDDCPCGSGKKYKKCHGA